LFVTRNAAPSRGPKLLLSSGINRVGRPALSAVVHVSPRAAHDVSTDGGIPGMLSSVVLPGVTTWNAFILPLVVLNSEDQWTLPLGVMHFASTYSSDAARTLAFTVVSLIPALVFYVIAERHIVGGLTAGSVKG